MTEAAENLRRATAVASLGRWPQEQAAGEITLAFAERHRRRLRMIDDAGLPFLLDLPAAVTLSDGDGLVLEDGKVIRVRAAAESVVDVSAPAHSQRVRLAWHVGSRHAPIQVLADGTFRILTDHVLIHMLEQLGATIIRRVAPFAPEPGAYGTVSHDHARSIHSPDVGTR